MNRGSRVEAGPKANPMRAGSVGTVLLVEGIDTLPMNNGATAWVLVEWDDSRSGPCWHFDTDIKEI